MTHSTARSREGPSARISKYRGLVHQSLRNLYPYSKETYLLPLTEELVAAVQSRDHSSLRRLKAELEGVYKWLTEAHRQRHRTLLGDEDKEQTVNNLWAYLAFLGHLNGGTNTSRGAVNAADRKAAALSEKWSNEGITYQGVENDTANYWDAVLTILGAGLAGSNGKALDPQNGLVEQVGALYNELMDRYSIDERPADLRRLQGMLTLVSYTLAMAQGRRSLGSNHSETASLRDPGPTSSGQKLR